MRRMRRTWPPSSRLRLEHIAQFYLSVIWDTWPSDASMLPVALFNTRRVAASLGLLPYYTTHTLCTPLVPDRMRIPVFLIGGGKSSAPAPPSVYSPPRRAVSSFACIVHKLLAYSCIQQYQILSLSQIPFRRLPVSVVSIPFPTPIANRDVCPSVRGRVPNCDRVYPA